MTAQTSKPTVASLASEVADLRGALTEVVGLLRQNATAAPVAEATETTTGGRKTRSDKGKPRGKRGTTVQHLGAPNHKVSCKCVMCERVRAAASKTPAERKAQEARQAEASENWKARRDALRPLNRGIAAALRGANAYTEDAFKAAQKDSNNKFHKAAFASLTKAEQKAVKQYL